MSDPLVHNSLETSGVTEKKLSPSQVKRNVRRKEYYLKRKSNNAKTLQPEKKKNVFKCNQCENLFKSENDLKNHMENAHKEHISFEHIEQLDGHTEVSPSLDN